MERTTTSDVRAEIDITENGVAFHLVIEDNEGSEIIENVEYLTFDELSDRSGDNIELQLSDTEPESATETNTPSSMVIPVPGDIVVDTVPPIWSEDGRVRVTGIADKNAGSYFVDEHGYKTVASENQDCDIDETVVEGTYVRGGNKIYAFPVSRLKQA